MAAKEIQNTLDDLNKSKDGGNKDLTKVYEDIQKLREADKGSPSQWKSDYAALSKGLQDAGILPALSFTGAENGQQLKVDTSSNLTLTDKTGAGITLDRNGKVSEVDYANNTSRKFEYDQDGKIKTVVDTDGHAWKRTDDGKFKENVNGKETGNVIDGTPSIDSNGTYKLDQGQGVDARESFAENADGSKVYYDRAGNVTKAQDSDGKSVDYHYTAGLITDVTDKDGSTWKREQDGRFHQLDQTNKETGETADGSKFVPPTTDRQLYGADGKIDPRDVMQHRLEDCYFMSSLAAVAQQNPDAVKNMIKDNNDGTYTVTFPGDKEHPVTIQAPTDAELGEYASEHNGTWAAVLEKAHRYQTGRVDFDPSDGSDVALKLLTGKDTNGMSLLPSTWAHDKWVFGGSQFDGGSNTDEVGAQLEDAMKNHRAVVANTGSKDDADNKPNGLAGDHGYSVLDYDASSQTVTLRNPWGARAPNTPQDIDSFKDLGDGTFTLSLDDFKNHYNNIQYQT